MKILIIESDSYLLSNLKKNLEQENYAVDVVSKGRVAERLIYSFRDDYDLIILDLSLEDVSGIEICQTIRNRGMKVPILVLSPENRIEERIKALDYGADDYVIKPFSLGEIGARIRAILRRPNGALALVTKIGNVEFHFNSKRVYRNGEELALTPKEFAIFEYLVCHPNQIMSRDQIFDHVWTFNENSYSNVVDVHMKNLRKKISTGKEDNAIETIWGFGYRLKKENPAGLATSRSSLGNNEYSSRVS
jgi:DNA-binding response OmpR family regulator